MILMMLMEHAFLEFGVKFIKQYLNLNSILLPFKKTPGTCPEDIRAEQVGEFAVSLNSDDVFILETPSKTWIWSGEGSDEDELEIAKGIGMYVYCSWYQKTI